MVLRNLRNISFMYYQLEFNGIIPLIHRSIAHFTNKSTVHIYAFFKMLQETIVLKKCLWCPIKISKRGKKKSPYF